MNSEGTAFCNPVSSHCVVDCDCLVIKPKATTGPRKKRAPAKEDNDMFNFSGKSKKATSSKEVASKASTKQIEQDELLNALFATIADEDDPECMTMDGIAKMCDEVEIDAAEDVKALVLCWKLGGTKPGIISKEEFCKGMKAFGIASWLELKGVIANGVLDLGFLETNTFREFFHFVFQFSREGTHKTIEKDTVLVLLPMVLDVNRAPHLTLFMDFLTSCATQRITLDQWDSFLRFNMSVDVDLGNFDDNGAWPLLLDDYVEWRNNTKTSG